MPFRNSWSAVGLSVAGDHAQGAAAGGHGFGRREVLSVDVRHRCGLAIVGVVAVRRVVHARGLRPHGAHGNFVELLHFHAVGDEGAADFVRLAVVPMPHSCSVSSNWP